MTDTHSAERDAREDARRAVTRLVHELLRQQHGDGAVTRRSLAPGPNAATIPGPADHVQGAEIARQVAAYARGLMAEYTLKARGDGATWDELAVPVGVGRGDRFGMAPGEAAFALIAGSRGTVSWRCGRCGGMVTDHGPYTNDPADNETGHTDSCSRHLSEIDAAVYDDQ